MRINDRLSLMFYGNVPPDTKWVRTWSNRAVGKVLPQCNHSNWNSLTDSARIALDTPLAETPSKPRIVVGSDHAGFRAKRKC